MPPKNKQAEPTPADEAAAETPAPEPIAVEWRGVTLTVPGDIIRDARFRLAIRSMDIGTIVYEALGPVEAGMLIATLRRGEDADTVLGEFLKDLRSAAGWGNSEASR